MESLESADSMSLSGADSVSEAWLLAASTSPKDASKSAVVALLSSCASPVTSIFKDSSASSHEPAASSGTGSATSSVAGSGPSSVAGSGASSVAGSGSSSGT
eukprot:18670_1